MEFSVRIVNYNESFVARLITFDSGRKAMGSVGAGMHE